MPDIFTQPKINHLIKWTKYDSLLTVPDATNVDIIAQITSNMPFIVNSLGVAHDEFFTASFTTGIYGMESDSHAILNPTVNYTFSRPLQWLLTFQEAVKGIACEKTFFTKIRLSNNTGASKSLYLYLYSWLLLTTAQQVSIS